MNAAFYALDDARPTLTVGHVNFFDVWAAMTTELASYYGEEPESFRTIEASWSNDDECAEVVTLNGRIVGALDRPLARADVAAIWGVNRMEKRAFINRIRSLYNIDGDLLPELTREQQTNFLADPVRYFLVADETQSDAIMREIEGRQNMLTPVAKSAGETARAANNQVVAKAGRKKKAKARVEGQRELLLPIAGGAGEAAVRAQASGRGAMLSPIPGHKANAEEPETHAPERRKAG